MQNRTRISTRMAIAALIIGAALVAALPLAAPFPARAVESGMSVDINAATADELMTLPGIGQAKASAILAYRTENGPFAAPEELLQVKGIGETLLQKIRPYVRTGASKKTR